MVNRQKVWMHVPPKPSKPKVPDIVKADVEQRANELLIPILRARSIKPPPEDPERNHIIDVFAKWHQCYFHFSVTYCSPGPTARSPSFNVQFARMEYRVDQGFGLSYKRYTGEWREIYTDLSVEDCFKAILEDPHFFR